MMMIPFARAAIGISFCTASVDSSVGGLLSFLRGKEGFLVSADIVKIFLGESGHCLSELPNKKTLRHHEIAAFASLANGVHFIFILVNINYYLGRFHLYLGKY